MAKKFSTKPHVFDGLDFSYWCDKMQSYIGAGYLQVPGTRDTWYLVPMIPGTWVAWRRRRRWRIRWSARQSVEEEAAANPIVVEVEQPMRRPTRAGSQSSAVREASLRATLAEAAPSSSSSAAGVLSRQEKLPPGNAFPGASSGLRVPLPLSLLFTAPVAELLVVASTPAEVGQRRQGQRQAPAPTSVLHAQCATPHS
uniref:Uncharacterized protein n=1 Tax=Oryza sativa subsp. japonica TaxID=39947 RepID=Q33AF4_ORYSJ|nr:hypothetical protein LOC_Os10g10510 [Oryza sativa Japonica Group]